MKNGTLCINCEHLINCVFTKNQPIWECEEFSVSGSKLKKNENLVKERIIHNEVTEEE